MYQGNGTVTVNDHCGGIAHKLHGKRPIRITGCHREPDPQLLLQRGDGHRVSIHRIHSDHGDLIGILAVCLLKIRKLLLAGFAFIVEEVQNHCLPRFQKLGQGMLRSVRIHDRKILNDASEGIADIRKALVLCFLRRKNDGSKLSGKRIQLFDGIFLRNTVQHRNIAVTDSIRKGHPAGGIRSVKPHKLRQGRVGVYIDADLLQSHTALGLKQNGIGHGSCFRNGRALGVLREGSRLRTFRLLLSAGRKQCAQAQNSRQDPYEHSFSHSIHTPDTIRSNRYWAS